MTHLSRRRFLQLATLGGATLVSACATPSLNRSTSTPATGGPSSDFTPDVEINIAARPAQAQLLPGKPTNIWSYAAEVVQGDAGTVQSLPDSAIGPILRFRKGQRVRVNFANNLPDQEQSSIIHWHGLMLPEAMDGHPRYAIAPGQTYTYEFEVTNRAGTYWYHPHPHGKTAQQAYHGMAGLLLVFDDEEAALSLPRGTYDLPIVIQDRTFDADNQLVYRAASSDMGGMSGMSGMNGMSDTNGMDMEAMMGFLGERILINGRPSGTVSVATRAYRLRLLNSSNARIYKLGWSNGTPLTVIGTDGGLLTAPVQRPYVMLAPGERIELWADFSGTPVGTELTLNSLTFSGAENPGGSMGGMMQTGNAPELGAPMTLLTVRVEREEQEMLTLPQQFTTITPLRPEAAVNAAQPREIALTLKGMQWRLNGRQFEMDAVAPEEVVKRNTLEQWTFVNKTNPGEMMDAMGMAHPMHIHGVQFQVVGREVLPELRDGWETVRAGYVDAGWKDTVLVMPGERVSLLMRFGQPGTFVYHCHNLEHEDNGMMRNYRVAA